MGCVAVDWLTPWLAMVHVPVANAVFFSALSLLSGGWIFQSRHLPTELSTDQAAGKLSCQDDPMSAEAVMFAKTKELSSHSWEEAVDTKAGMSSCCAAATSITPGAVEAPSQTKNSLGSERDRKPKTIPGDDSRAKQPEAPEKSGFIDKHRLAPGTGIKDMRTGRWLIFVWAEWCPHSRNYHKVWQELISRQYDPAASPWHEGQKDKAKPPRLVSTIIRDNPELVASFKMEKLPTFILLDEGKARGRVIASPSLEQLQELLRSDWNTITPLGSGKLLSGKTSEILVASIKLFDFFGRITYQTEEFLFHWIANHKVIVYIALAISMLLIYRLRKSPWIEYL